MKGFLFLNHCKCNSQQTESNSKDVVKNLLFPEELLYQKDVVLSARKNTALYIDVY